MTLQTEKNDLELVKEFKEQIKEINQLKARFSERIDAELAFMIMERSKNLLDIFKDFTVIPKNWYDEGRRSVLFDLIYYFDRYLNLTNNKIYPHDHLNFVEYVHEFFFEYKYNIPPDPFIEIWIQEKEKTHEFSIELLLTHIQKAIDLISKDEKFTKVKYVRYDIIGNLYLEMYFITLKYSNDPEEKYLELANQYYNETEKHYDVISKPIRTMRYLTAFIDYLSEELNIVNIYDFNWKINNLRTFFPKFFKK
jgi:hypothetical protein